MALVLIALLGSVFPGFGSRPAPGTDQELLDRTLALVGGQAITLSDARAAIALGLVDVPAGAEPIAAATTALVDRALVLREVQRYAPPAPAESEVDARMEETGRRLPAGAALATVLRSHGLSETRLRAWLRDDLRTQAYLAQRFASAALPGDTEVSAAYVRQRAEFDKAGLTFEQAAPLVRDRLVAARRAERVADWLSELRRRTDVVVLR